MTKQFSDFKIEAPKARFIGDKIKMKSVLNAKITVLDFIVERSKFDKGSGNCLRLQIMFNGEKRVLFTGSSMLIKQISQIVPVTQFETTIIETEEQFLFT